MTSHLPLASPAIEHVLARRGENGYRQYRIPALAVTPQGTLLAAYDGRANLDDLPSPIDLLLRRSTDNGLTWEKQQIVRTGTGLEGFGDPSLVIDTQTGRIFIFHAAGTKAGFFESTTGHHPEDEYIQHCDLSFSDDDGLTWQHRRLTDQLKGSLSPGLKTTGFFAAAGQGIQVHAGAFQGRLIQQFVLLCGGEIMAASAYSDDHGENWTMGKPISAASGGEAPNENKVVSLSDGRLLLHSRARPRRLYSFSNDGGQNWGPLKPVDDLPDPSDNGSLTRFDGLPGLQTHAQEETDSWLLATNNQDPDLRRNTVLSLSIDDGKTWPAKLLLCKTSSAYSTAARLANGNIGVLYERDGYREIVFLSIEPTQLFEQLPDSKTQRPAKATPQGQGIAFDMELRSFTPGLPFQWKHVGEFHILRPVPADWGREAWKEIGQGYSPDQGQIIGTREAQDLNYGQIIPGYKPGDIIAFSGRVKNYGPLIAKKVKLFGPGSENFPEESLSEGQKILYFSPTYTVTEEDLRKGVFDVEYFLEATINGQKLRKTRLFSFDSRTGSVSSREE